MRIRGARPTTITGCATAAIMVGAFGPAVAASGDSQPTDADLKEANAPSVRFASSGEHSEIRNRLPIADDKWEKKRVAMTARLPTLRKGDVLRTTGAVLHGRIDSKRFRTAARRSPAVPIAPSGKTGRRVIYSQRINKLRKSDVIEASARTLITVASVHYPVFIGSDAVLARGPPAVSSAGIPRQVASGNGDLTEQNGFNCTHGPSAYQDPCRTRKSGAVRITRNVRRHGRSVPLWVNLVSAGAPKGAVPKHGDRMRVLPRGRLVVRRYRGG